MEATVVKRVSFDAAHFLPYYVGKCHNMHGHHWVVELGIKGEMALETGMVVDFTLLKDFLKTHVERFDHTNLNDFFPNPTAERLAEYIGKMFDVAIKEGYFGKYVRLAFIRVWETEDSNAELQSEQVAFS